MVLEKMCIEIAAGNRKPYGFLFKNDLNEFVYCCSRCDEEFRLGNDLEQHSVSHDVKEECDIVANQDLVIELGHIEVYSPHFSAADNVKSEAIPLDNSTKEEMAIYLPLETHKLEVNIEEKGAGISTVDPEPLDNDFDYLGFPNESSTDDDFFPATIKKKSTKKTSKAQKESKKNTYTCEICSRIFTSLARIKQHMIAGHIRKKKQAKRPLSPTLCTLCGKHIRDMKTHLKIFHSTERPFKCDYCEATFKQKVHRDTHVRQHTGEKPYVNP